MTLASDVAVDRRRLKRRLSLWRAVAILAVAGLVAWGVARERGVAFGRHITRLAIKGVIVDDLERNRDIAKLAKDGEVKAVIVHLDTPGGTVVGGERLYHALRTVAEKKPVVAVMGTQATSAGYMVALAADRLLANSGSVTGSIGVILQSTDVTKLLETIGVATEAIKSAPLKGVPSPLEKLTPAGREATKAVVDDIYAQFVELVAERRKLPAESARELADGRIYTGRQAMDKGLIDELGGEDEALAWLKKVKGVDDKLPIRDLDLEQSDTGLFGLGRAMAWVLGGKTLVSERLTLDGLVSVWHPQ